MFRIMKWIAPITAITLLFALSQLPARAAKTSEAGKATITVTVVDKDGKPVEGVKVALVARHKGKSAAEQPNDANSTDAATKQHSRPTPVAEGATNADGKAVLQNVPDGEYGLLAHSKTGMARDRITVQNGMDMSAKLKLQARQSSSGKNGEKSRAPAGSANPPADQAPAGGEAK